MGAHICFDRHIHIANKPWSKGVLSHLGYEDIDEQTLNEIVNNKKLKWIQISGYLSKNRPDTFGASRYYFPSFSFSEQ